MIISQSDKKFSSIEDPELIQKFRSTGDLEYLGALYDRYIHLVYGVCLKYLQNREESKDAVMQIFEKLMDELTRHDVRNFKSWLHVLTKNFCLMYIRSEKSKLERYKQLQKEGEVFMEYSLDMHHNGEMKLDRDISALKSCIEKLKAEQKECIRLFYLQEKCYQEISAQLDMDMKKVKSHIQNGKRNLKICIESTGVEN